MNYKEKLLDPRWQKKRLEVLNRDGFSCRFCSDTKTTLHVHHKVYEKGKEPWDIDSKLLITLCKDCHEQEEKNLKDYSEIFLDSFRRTDFFGDDLREIAWGLDDFKLHHEKSWVVAEAIAIALRSETIQKFLLQIRNEYVSRGRQENVDSFIEYINPKIKGGSKNCFI